MRLYTFHISHFSEKVRFALDLSGLPYEEKPLLPGAHFVTTRRIAKESSVPILVDGKDVVQGSSAILDRLASRHAYRALEVAPEHAARAGEVEAMCDRAFGRGTQTLFYSVLLESPGEIGRMWMQRGPRWAGAFYKVALRFIVPKVREAYDVHEAGIEAARVAYERAFEEMDRATEGREFLFGDTLSRADLTVAALLAPLVQPKEHPFKWRSERPPKLDAFASVFRGRPTWKFVERIYREHRRAR
ncbi:MAG TPA: glutathione S-transferase [Polyangiaceae bacterium]|jgi:glutathione S-transferase